MKESEQPPKENSGHSFTEGMDITPNDLMHEELHKTFSEEPAHTVDKVSFDIVKIERTYANGHKDFVEGAMLENYLDNLKIADGFAVSRSYIQFKPVAWDVSPSPERVESDGWISVHKYEVLNFDGEFYCFEEGETFIASLTGSNSYNTELPIWQDRGGFFHHNVMQYQPLPKPPKQ